MSATTVFGLACWAVLATEPGCLAAQGHWSSGTGQCYTRLCLLQGDCGERAAPIAGCAGLQPGDSRGKVYFQLGNPLGGAGMDAQWSAHKTSSDRIVARFADERLVSLQCPATN